MRMVGYTSFVYLRLKFKKSFDNCKAWLSFDYILITGGTDPMDQIRFIPDDRYVALTSPNRTIRLVDGPSVNEGIVQLLEGDYWRSVCTNSRNWTVSDMNVACRQLGFTGGEWYHWYPHLNDTRQIMFQEPGNWDFFIASNTVTNLHMTKNVLLQST